MLLSEACPQVDLPRFSAQVVPQEEDEHVLCSRSAREDWLEPTGQTRLPQRARTLSLPSAGTGAAPHTARRPRLNRRWMALPPWPGSTPGLRLGSPPGGGVALRRMRYSTACAPAPSTYKACAI